ncbi:MAG: hypothetical protein RJA25_2359 [Bacteroidota bacterium]|jgi:hypothetical protein
MNDFIKLFLVVLLSGQMNIFAQKKSNTKLPIDILQQFINSTEKFELNDATAFKHVDLPKSYHNIFLSFIKDSSVAEIAGIKSPIYYRITLKNGNFYNGDVYLNGNKSFIIFKINEKKYINYFTPEGVVQIKNIFKL